MARRQSPTARFGRVASAGFPGVATGTGQIYLLMLALLFVLFMMIATRGKVPHVLEKVFAAPPATPESIASRRTEVAKALNGAYYDPADGTDFAETEGYRRLLGKMIDHVRPGDVVAEPMLLDRNLAMASPDVQRGETLKVRGVVADYVCIKLDRPLFQLTDVWRLWITDDEGENGIVVDLTEKPPSLVTQRDKVDVVGTFYRLVRYDSRKGGTRELPYMIARTASLSAEQTARSGNDGALMMVILLALAGMIVWGIVRIFRSRARTPVIRWRAPHIG